MATDVVINGETHSGVEAVNLMKTDGTTEQFYPDAVRYVTQTLTEEQQAQARSNIGVVGTGKNGEDGFSPIVEPNFNFVGGEQFTITDKNGSHVFTIRDGEHGYSPVKGIDYWTDEDKKEIAEEAVTDEVMQQLISMLATPVFGTVDAENNIILSGKLVNGTYTFKYEMDNGELVTIGTLTQTASGAISVETITPVWNKSLKLDSATGVANADPNNTYAYSDSIPFIDGTEIHISCSDCSGFRCSWYYYDANDNLIYVNNWVENTPGEKPEEAIPKVDGAAVVKLRCNIVDPDDTWADLDRLTVTRVYL